MTSLAASGGWPRLNFESEEEKEFCSMMAKLDYFYSIELLPVPPSPRGPMYGFELKYWPHNCEADRRIIWGPPNSDIARARSGAFAAGLKKLDQLSHLVRTVGAATVASPSAGMAMGCGRGRGRGRGHSPATLPLNIQGPKRLPTLEEIYGSDDDDDDDVLPVTTSSNAKPLNKDVAELDQALKNLHLCDNKTLDVDDGNNNQLEDPRGPSLDVENRNGIQFEDDPFEPTMYQENRANDRSDDIQFQDQPLEPFMALGNRNRNVDENVRFPIPRNPSVVLENRTFAIRDNDDGNFRFPIPRDRSIVLESWDQRRLRGWDRNKGNGGEDLVQSQGAEGARKVEKRKRP